MNMTEQQKIDFLKEEYFYLQKQCDEYDNRALIIKSWSLTASLAGIVTGYTENAPSIFLISALCSILFWIIESLWKSFQSVIYKRLRKIEDYFYNKGDLTSLRIPYVTGSWNYNYSKMTWNDRCKIAWRPNVFLPHLIIFIVGLLLYVIQSPHLLVILMN